MKNRNYNPLNEGYSGRSKQYSKDGYTGGTHTASEAPKTLSSIQSAVTKPNNQENKNQQKR